MPTAGRFNVSFVASELYYIPMTCPPSLFDLQLGRSLLLLHARHVLLSSSSGAQGTGMARLESRLISIMQSGEKQCMELFFFPF